MKLRERNNELEKRNSKLMWDVLKMRLEFEVIAENPESKAAKKIIARYRLRRDIRNEISKATQN